MSTATAGDMEETVGVPHRQMDRETCLREIGRLLGIQGHKRTQLHKQDLNSLVWALTGSVAFRWKRFGTEQSPDFYALRKKAADAVGFAYYEGRRKNTETGSRRFRQNELRAIVYALRESEDQRDFFEGRDV